MCESNWLGIILINLLTLYYWKLSLFLNNRLYEHVSKYYIKNIFLKIFQLKIFLNNAINPHYDKIKM